MSTVIHSHSQQKAMQHIATDKKSKEIKWMVNKTPSIQNGLFTEI